MALVGVYGNLVKLDENKNDRSNIFIHAVEHLEWLEGKGI